MSICPQLEVGPCRTGDDGILVRAVDAPRLERHGAYVELLPGEARALFETVARESMWTVRRFAEETYIAGTAADGASDESIRTRIRSSIDQGAVVAFRRIIPGNPQTGDEEQVTATGAINVFTAGANGVLRLKPAVAGVLQRVFDRLVGPNGSYRLEVGGVEFVLKDLGGPPGHTDRDRVEISPAEQERPLRNQLYVIGHELTHVLQFKVSSGANADAKWESMTRRYAADEAKYGKQGQYLPPAELLATAVSNLNVLDARFALEAIARRVGFDARDALYDR